MAKTARLGRGRAAQKSGLDSHSYRMPALVNEPIPHFCRDPSVVFGFISLDAPQATLANNVPHTDQFLSVGIKEKIL